MNLKTFHTASLFDAATNLFAQLGIKLNSNTATILSARDLLGEHFRENPTFYSIAGTYYIGTIDDSIFQTTGLFDQNYTIDEARQQANSSYDGLMLFALTLDKSPTRTEISTLTRAFNRISQKMPVALLLKYDLNGETAISLALSERFKYKQQWRQGEKAGKVIILKDILIQHTHTGHLKILKDLVKPAGITTYAQLHSQWLEVLDVNILNKRFYKELASWYFWALDVVEFPDDTEKNREVRNATNLIRLITRIIFIWFIKEKSLIPEALFSNIYLKKIIHGFNQNAKSKNYYPAVLQNLFFATLNQKMDERKFAQSGNIDVNIKEYGVKNLFRYAGLFTISENEILELFKDIPFLNGGLFDCLDNPEGRNVYIDGFSRNPRKMPFVPDELFFGAEREVDLNNVFATRNKRYSAQGLIKLLESYKFTITENTPLEEEVALDPELLGKVFENLLASYNPETKTTARKQTGSFYTPREIVNYMVDESLLEYLKQGSNSENTELEARLRELFSYSEHENPFDEAETHQLVEAINNCKILDPACGSGAFPMGILHKMVHILQKLDPCNERWKEQQREKIIGEQIRQLEKDKKAIQGLSDRQVREKAIQAVEDRLVELEDIFNRDYNFDDYSRKLFLIENCIYGIDIQPIAVQITKLRFFISLVIDQKVNKSKENFGVRSLPNLETKFVAANTLIGLDKPQLKTGDIFLNDIFQNINRLSSELKDLRHKYFTANNRKDKLELQKEDRKLRASISVELEKIGHTKPNAVKIANFDPYDQNQSSPWFDPEWMFGLSEGFDAVIGNPPYIQMQKDGGKLADALKDRGFETFERTGDIYCIFYEKGIQSLKDGGNLCYITSNKWMRAGYGKSTRAFLLKHKPLKLIDLGGGIFETATVDTNILLIQKTSKKPQQIAVEALDLSKEKENINFENYRNQWVLLDNLNDESWTISSPIEQRIKKKIEARGIPLKDWDININYGIKTGFNEAFIIDGNKKAELIAQDPKSAEIIKPLLRGRDIKRYKAEFADLWLIYVPWHFPLQNNPEIRGASLLAEKELEKQFPAIYKHLLSHKKSLSARNKAETGIRYEWYALQRWAADYHQEFEKEKIMYPNMTLYLPFILDNNGFFLNDKGFILAANKNEVSLRFLLGYFNSRFAHKWIRENCPELQGGTRELRKIFFENIPIPKASVVTQNKISSLANEITLLKIENNDTTALENRIDELVFKLYGLTYEEVKVIAPDFWLGEEEYEQIVV